MNPEDFNYLDPAVQGDPMPFFAVLREQAPVYREPHTGAYFITRAEDLRFIAEHPEIFSNRIDPTVFRACHGLSLERLDPEVAGILKSMAWLVPHTILLTDPPTHGRYRRLVLEALSPKAVARIEPFIRGQVARFIVALDGEQEVDFLHAFAERLPLSIILHFLGAAEDELPRVNGWTDQFFSTIMGQTSRQEYLKSVHAICDLLQFVAARIEEVKQRPDDSLLHTLLHAHEATGDEPLTLEETLSIFQVLLVAGHDTTRQTLTNAVRILATNRDLFLKLRTNRPLIKPFIEEVVRMYSPANVTPRYTVQEVELGGTRIPKDSPVFLAWGSGNRDPQLCSDPDTFVCPRQTGSSHLGFGAGIHFCAGMRLARSQLTLTLEALLDRYARIELAVPEPELAYLPAINLRALARLPIRCTRDVVGEGSC